MESTFVMLKPDVVKDGKVGEILDIIIRAGFKITQLKIQKINPNIAKELYKEHFGKNFFQKLVEYICSGDIVAMVLKKQNAVRDFRLLMGSSNLSHNTSDTLRFKFAKNEQVNAIHSSDSIANAEFEINLFFD